MQQQQAEIDSIASAMDEMTSTVQEVARSAAEASRAADNADHDAKSGALVATEALGGIDALLGEVDSAAQVIRNLEKESENIGAVLEQSTQEIHDMIQRLQDGAVNAVKVMEGAQSKAQSSSDHVENVAESLASIAGAVSNINDMNTMIASAAEEQSSVAAEMQANMNNIREVSDRSAEGSKQTAQASEELARLAAEQQELMSRFRL